MPLNVRRFNTSVFLVLSAFILAASAQAPQASPSPLVQLSKASPSASPSPSVANAQTNKPAPAQQLAPQPLPKTPTSAEVMRDRISKAKAFIAVRNYNAAIYELENIRRETGDASVQAVTNVLLMNSYLEQGDYKRGQDFLNEFYNKQKTTAPNASANYSAVAGQVIKGARSQAERYRSLGLTVSDRNLPLEAVADIEKMRETVELVITQAKEIAKDKQKAATATALLEEATASRAMIARDDYDARRWRDEVADSREALASSRSVIVNAVDGTPESAPAAPQQQATVAMTPTQPATPAIIPTADVTQPKPSEATMAANNPPPVVEEAKKTDDKPVMKPVMQPTERNRVIAGAPTTQLDEAKKEESGPNAETAKTTGPLDVGSLVAYATRQSSPIYPPAARTIRAAGVVRVEVTVDEQGNVAEVQKASGPALLQGSAKDAIRKWKFKPFLIDGQPVKATGFVNFNFSL